MKANVIKKLRRTTLSGANTKSLISRKILEALDSPTDNDTLIDVIVIAYDQSLPNAKAIIDKVENSFLQNELRNLKVGVTDGYLSINDKPFIDLEPQEVELFNHYINTLKNAKK